MEGKKKTKNEWVCGHSSCSLLTDMSAVVEDDFAALFAAKFFFFFQQELLIGLFLNRK